MALPTVTSVAVVGGGTLAPFGGTSVTITGTNFNNGNVTAVRFGSGGPVATSFTIDSGTQITAVAPAKLGFTTVDVVVTNPSGNSSLSSGDQVSYGTSFSPSVEERDEDPTAVAAGAFTTMAPVGLFPTHAIPAVADWPLPTWLGLGVVAQYAAGGGVSLV